MIRDFSAFVARAVRAQCTSIPPREVFIPQFVDAGYGSLMLLTILTFFAGLNLAVQSFGPFSRIGAQDMLGMFAGIGGVRELFPVMAAVVGGARIGANVAASLANMKISEQIEALEVMGVDPIRYLVVPRIWAVTLALPLLCGYCNVIGLASAYGGAVYQLGNDPGTFVHQVMEQVSAFDLAAGMIKGVFMGWGVGLISCFHGYSIQKRDGAEGVGIATNLAIVNGAVFCIVTNLLMSWIMYG
jgi:phospholipid/cholesterol/gamma-HCH transport system permease protein